MIRIKDSFLLIVFLACFTCFARADYNLILFAFAFILWDREDDQKARLIYLMLFSWIIDLTWLCYWTIYWKQQVFQNVWSNGVHNFVLIISYIEFSIKFIIILFCACKDPSCSKALTPSGFLNNLRILFGGEDTNQEEFQNNNNHNVK